MKKTTHRLFSILLTLIMVLGMLPITAFASDNVTFNTPEPITKNGVTATVTFDLESPRAEGTEVTATITLSGKALAKGLHTISLFSATEQFWGEAQDFSVTEGQTDFTGVALKTYTFVVPAEAVNDLTLDHTFVVPKDYTLYLYNGKGYENTSDGNVVNIEELGITPVSTESGYKYIFDSVNFATTKREGVVIGGENVTIELKNGSTIKSSSSDNETVGMTVIGNLTVEGEGELNVFAGDTINGGSRGIKMSYGSLTIKGGTLMAFAGETMNYSNGIEMSSNNAGDIIVNCGTLMGFGRIGIYANKDITVNGGVLEGHGTDSNVSNRNSEGIFIYGEGGLMVYGGEVRGFAGSSKSMSYGIEVYSGDLVVRGGGVEGHGGSSDDDSYGIYTHGDVSIINGNVTGNSGDAEKNSYGFCVTEDCTILGGEVKMSGASRAFFNSKSPITQDKDKVNVMNVIAGSKADASEANDVTGWIGAGSDNVIEYKYMYFLPGMRDVYVSAEPSEGGTVTGEGLYSVYSPVTVEATAKDGWHFVKWTEGGEEVSTNASYNFTLTESRNLVAVFSDKYSVIVNQGYTDASGEGDYDEGDKVEIFAGKRSGYTFNGWTSNVDVSFEDESKPSTSFLMPDKNVEVTANWKKNSGGGGTPSHDYYTLTFDTNGGSSVASINKIEGTTVSLSTYNSTRTGYEFIGWYSDAALTNKVSSVDLTKDTTVYAGWENEPVKLINPFIDLFDSDWFYEDVLFAYENDLMKGTSDNTFSPNIATTRGMIVTVLYRLENEPDVFGACPFNDVEPGSYYEDAITWAAQNGIVGGYGDDNFGPDDNITREQMAAILYRYANYKGYDLSAGENTNILSYEDAFDIRALCQMLGWSTI